MFQKRKILFMSKNKVMVIAVHPDDETLGCGGTILKHKFQGDEVHWCIVTTTIGNSNYDENFNQLRTAQIEEVYRQYQFDSQINLDLPTANLDAIPFNQVLTKIVDALRKVQPDILYVPYKNDIHTDHQVVANACQVAVKSFRFPFIKSIRAMEVLSETEYALFSQNQFAPNLFVGIDSFIEKKINIMKIYKSEISDAPFPRSVECIKAQAILRGSMCNLKFAEAFLNVKEIW